MRSMRSPRAASRSVVRVQQPYCWVLPNWDCDSILKCFAQLERGHDIYDQSCQQCHGDAATGEGALPGAPVPNSAGHTWHHADSQLVDIVLGRLEYPGRTMPPFESSMTETDVMDVLAYIKIGLGHAQAEAQATVTTNSR